MTCKSKAILQQLRNHPLLGFTGEHEDQTGVVDEYKLTTRYKSLHIRLFPQSGRIEIKGSLHYYFNQGYHNANEFTLKDVSVVIDELEQVFGINPSLFRLENLEYGINIPMPFDPNFIINNLLVYKHHPFDQMSIVSKGNGREVKLTEYILKIYNKSLQFGLSHHVLRFEKKVLRMKNIKAGVLYLKDLKSPELVAKCLMQLVKTLEEVQMEEEVNIALLSAFEKERYQLCINPRSWGKMERKARNKIKNQFKHIIDKAGVHKRKQTLQSLLVNHAEQLCK